MSIKYLYKDGSKYFKHMELFWKQVIIWRRDVKNNIGVEFHMYYFFSFDFNVQANIYINKHKKSVMTKPIYDFKLFIELLQIISNSNLNISTAYIFINVKYSINKY